MYLRKDSCCATGSRIFQEQVPLIQTLLQSQVNMIILLMTLLLYKLKEKQPQFSMQEELWWSSMSWVNK